MNNKDNFEVALVKRACPLCGKLEDSEIVINTILTKSVADKVKKLHGQTVGYTEKPCSDCQDLMSKGFLLIGVIEEKTEDKENPYRSGHRWVIESEAAENVFGKEFTKNGAAFIDVNVAKEAGLPLNGNDL